MDFQIGENIRKIRELRGFSQDYMANQLNISQKSYSNIETDKKQIVQKDLLLGIAKALDIDPVKLLTFDDNSLFNNVFLDKVDVAGGAFNSIYNSMEQGKRLYESQIEQLKEENKFLKERITFLESLIQKE